MTQMTTKHRTIVMTALLTVPAVLALAQEPPAPPAAPEPPAAARWQLPRLAPPATPRAWTSDVPLPPEPAFAPMPPFTPTAPLPPMPAFAPMGPGPLAVLAGIPPLPPDLAELTLAFQDAPRAARPSDASRAQRDAQRELQRAQSQEDRDYRQGKSDLDHKNYDRAIEYFNRIIENKGSRSDGALYWRAYAQSKLGKRDEAIASLDELQKSYASSRWMEDAKALQVEVRQQSGQTVSPDSATDEDLKLIVISGLSNSDPERATPLLEKLLKSSNSPRLKERALFVLAQNHSTRSREVLTEVAKGGTNPDLQSKAIEYLGVFGGRDNLQTLVDVYKSTNDVHMKRLILNSFMVSGSRDNLLAVAKSESNQDLKVQAIQLLGNVGASVDLAQLYTSDAPLEVKKAVIQGLFVAGNSDKLIELAKTEKDEGVRRMMINQLGVMGRSKAGPALINMYPQETTPEGKKAIINALFIQGNAAAMVEIARKETDMNIKKFIVNQLSLMHSKEATDYLMEILSK
jgi:HEAT repeat protein